MSPTKSSPKRKTQSRRRQVKKKTASSRKPSSRRKATAKTMPTGTGATFAFSAPSKPKAESLVYAHKILSSGIESVCSLAETFEESTKSRGRGATTHADQDLLRAMLVMAGSTLDATTKRIIQDSLRELVRLSEHTKEAAGKHLQRELFKELDKKSEGLRLAAAFLDESPSSVLIGYVIDDLIGTSYQSVNQVEKVIKMLDISNMETKHLQEAFDARNQIIHELDATPETKGQGSRKRRRRAKRPMYDYSKDLLKVATQMMKEIDGKLIER